MNCKKVAYGSRTKARADATKLAKIGRSLTEYKCDKCKKYHLTKARFTPYTVLRRLISDTDPL